mmetsp:Transcript_19349/g.45741  ORF Transcript_19349/g.45741 Transcript_19349/m.45741 type:complete len:279 (+) Transcript_19349:697-1533(+)
MQTLWLGFNKHRETCGTTARCGNLCYSNINNIKCNNNSSSSNNNNLEVDLGHNCNPILILRLRLDCILNLSRTVKRWEEAMHNNNNSSLETHNLDTLPSDPCQLKWGRSPLMSNFMQVKTAPIDSPWEAIIRPTSCIIQYQAFSLTQSGILAALGRPVDWGVESLQEEVVVDRNDCTVRRPILAIFRPASCSCQMIATTITAAAFSSRHPTFRRRLLHQARFHRRLSFKCNSSNNNYASSNSSSSSNSNNNKALWRIRPCRVLKVEGVLLPTWKLWLR